MSRRAAVLQRLVLASSTAALLAAGAACNDTAERPAPTAPKASAARAAAAPAPAASSGSTVCLSYVTKRAAMAARLKHSKELMAQSETDETSKKVESLEQQVEKLDAIVADACS